MRSCFALNDQPRFLPGAVVAKLGRLKDGEAGRPDVGSGFVAKQFRYYDLRVCEGAEFNNNKIFKR